MSAYVPHTREAVLAAMGLVAATLVLALLVTRLRSARAARVAAWALVVLALWAADRTTAGQPPGFRMLVLIGVLLYAMKAVVSVEARAQDGTSLTAGRWLAFATLWPGMRPALFAAPRRPRPGGWPLVAHGLLRLAGGAALFAAARLVWRASGSLLLATLALLPALSLILHFGAFGVIAGLWRLFGVDATPLFRAPLRSRGLGEFWARRWNIAFSEMTALAVYRPLSEAAGRPAALLAGFALSGIFHEVAISLPVGGGLGGPFLYFALHGLLTLAERRRGPFGRVATVVSLVVPLPLLFHPPFLRGVVWPLLGAPA